MNCSKDDVGVWSVYKLLFSAFIMWTQDTGDEVKTNLLAGNCLLQIHGCSTSI